MVMAKRRAVLVAAAAVFVVVAATVVYSTSVFGFRDPTEGTRAVELVNDSGTTVKISLCADQSCRHLASGGAVLGSGDLFRQNVQPSTVIPFAVAAPLGATPKCEVLHVGVTVESRYSISSLTPCAQS
jgi:hypothetical protein